MKHNINAIIMVVALFFVAQFVGLAVTESYNLKPDLPLNIERPQIAEEQKSYTFVYMIVFILLATGLVLLLLKLNWLKVWKFWFLLSVWFTLTISFNAFVAERIAIAMAVVFALLKVYKNNVIIHNFTELFIYGALVAIFAPLLNIISAVALLLAISIYDFIAVRKTKHMIKLAEFQSKSKLFAGLFLPYSRRAKKQSKKKVEKRITVKKKTRTFSAAFLGGGDIGFPLLFAGVVMRELGLKFLGFKMFIIPLFAAASLFLLFYFGKDKKYYPAMPYITAGCLLGYLVVYLL